MLFKRECAILFLVFSGMLLPAQNGSADGPTTCYATIVSVNVPVIGTQTFAAGAWSYSCNWTINFGCSPGQISDCYCCAANIFYVSSDNGNTWTNLGGSSWSRQPQTCNQGHVLSLTTTLAPLTTGDLYSIQYLAEPVSPSTGCGELTWYTLYQTQQFVGL